MDFARRGARAGRGGRGQRQFGNLEDTSRRIWSHVGNGRQGHVGNKIGLYIGRMETVYHWVLYIWVAGFRITWCYTDRWDFVSPGSRRCFSRFTRCI